MSKQVLVLYSGGADSVYMLILAAKLGYDVTAVMIDYGQKHVDELRYGRELAEKKFHQQVLLVDLKGATAHSRSNLLAKDPGRYSFAGVHEMHVPGRNGLFVFTALGIAETRNLDEVWIGCDYDDRVHLFPDCYQEWIVRMDQIAQISGSKPIRVKAPCLGLTKQDVLGLLAAEGIDLKAVYSGYTPPK